MHISKTQAQSPIPILNQLTMVQLTINNATMQIPNPKSHITNLPARPRVPDVPLVPFVPYVPFVPDVSDVSDVSSVSDVRDVRDVSNVRGVSANARCPKKNRTPKNLESRVGGPRVSKGSASIWECGIRTSNRPAKAGTQNSIAFHAFQVFQAFHFFHSFQPFQKRAVSAKNETPNRNSIREFVLRFFYGFIW